MLIPYISLTVKQNAYTTANMTVPPHEAAVLAAVFGSHSLGKPKVRHIQKEVEPIEEYDRLYRKYGTDREDTKRPFVEIAFGRFPEGRFEKSMKEGARHYFKQAGLNKKGGTKSDKPPKPQTLKPAAKDQELSPQKRAAITRAANRAKAEQEAENGENAQATA